MTFKDGEEVEEEVCPKCGAPLFYEMSFRDEFSYTTGHYTSDCPMKVCNKCDYAEEIEYQEDEYEPEPDEPEPEEGKEETSL
jgi:hypothetical protein